MNMSLTLNKEFIQEYMKKNEINSLNQLARDIGISETLLFRLMKGERKPGQKTIGKMMSFFGVKFEQIFMVQN